MSIRKVLASVFIFQFFAFAISPSFGAPDAGNSQLPPALSSLMPDSPTPPSKYEGDRDNFQVTTPFPEKGCIPYLENGGYSFKCVAGGSQKYPCSSNADCILPHCTTDSCIPNGRGALCENPSDCLDNGDPYFTCQHTERGHQCLPGNAGLSCDPATADCVNMKACHVDRNFNPPHAKCIPGGEGASCSASFECTQTTCELDHHTLKFYCSAGVDNNQDSQCLSDKDCPQGDLRCRGQGWCYNGTQGALCSHLGTDDACSSLYCEKDANGNARCVKSTDARGRIQCGSDASEGDACSTPNTTCQYDGASKTYMCKPNGSGAKCSADADCSDSRCEGLKCVRGGTGKKCSADAQCEAKICKRGADQKWVCVTDEMGAGGPACTSQCTHLECDSWKRKCVLVDGPGYNECRLGNYSDCNDTVEQYGKIDQKEYLSEAKFRLSDYGINPFPQDPRTPAPQVRQLLKKLPVEPSIGAPNAPIQIVLFQDFTCGMCKALHARVFDRFKTEFVDTGKARISFVDFPLIQRESDGNLIRGAYCADKQNRYLDFMDKIFKMDNPNETAPDPFPIAQNLGLNQSEFSNCMNSSESAKRLTDNIEGARLLGVQGTPEVYVNGNEFGGLRDYKEWRAAALQVLSEVGN